MKQKISPPARTARGVRSRGTTLFSPGGALGACNGASRPALLIRSGGRLREQSSTGLPHRLAASAGSLEAGGPVFLPIQVFEVYTGAILREVCGFVKRRREIRRVPARILRYSRFHKTLERRLIAAPPQETPDLPKNGRWFIAPTICWEIVKRRKWVGDKLLPSDIPREICPWRRSPFLGCLRFFP